MTLVTEIANTPAVPRRNRAGAASRCAQIRPLSAIVRLAQRGRGAAGGTRTLHLKNDGSFLSALRHVRATTLRQAPASTKFHHGREKKKTYV